MVHEPFLSFSWKSPRQNAPALVHRFMTLLLLRAARRVWISIPGWEDCLRPYAMGRKLPFEWLPIFSNISVAEDPVRTQSIRRQYVDDDDNRVLVGHFGTFGTLITSLLEPIIVSLADDPPAPVVLLIGERSGQFRENLIRKEPRLAKLVRATGQLPADEISHHLAACDILIQPYPDGVSSRRTSFMAGLSHGKPIVTTAGHLTEPLWKQHSAVALAPAGDARAFVEEVRRLSQDAAGRLRAGRAAYQLYHEQFDISRTILALRRTGSAKDRKCAS
jgi:glycosyltransferase involved in cell wall biosynthesis